MLTALLPLLAVSGVTTDRVATIGYQAGAPKQPAHLLVLAGNPFDFSDSPNSPGGGPDATSPGGGGGGAAFPGGSGLFGIDADMKFFAFGGKRPMVAVFGADIDGDMQDEFVVLRDFTDRGGRYSLTVHPVPVGFENVNEPIVKSGAKALGTRPLFGAIIAADGIDLDGDLIDELMTVRETENGSQRLEVFEMPGKSGTIGAPLASFLGLGSADENRIVDVTAIDMNGDAKEEIAILREDAAGKQTIEIVASPKAFADFTPLAFSTLLPPADLKFPIDDIDGADVDGDGIDEVVVHSHVLIFVQTSQDPSMPPQVFEFDRLDVLPLLAGGAGIPGDPSAAPILFASDTSHTIAENVILRGPNPKPGIVSEPLDVLLNDSFDGKLVHQEFVPGGGYVGGSTTTVTVSIKDVIGKLDVKKFTLNVPGGSGPIGGDLDPVTGGVAIGNDHSLDLGLPGSDVLHLEFSNLQVATYGSLAIIHGSYTGTVWHGVGSGVPIVEGQFSIANK